jgi:hypothetical protein
MLDGRLCAIAPVAPTAASNPNVRVSITGLFISLGLPFLADFGRLVALRAKGLANQALKPKTDQLVPVAELKKSPIEIRHILFREANC